MKKILKYVIAFICCLSFGITAVGCSTTPNDNKYELNKSYIEYEMGTDFGALGLYLIQVEDPSKKIEVNKDMFTDKTIFDNACNNVTAYIEYNEKAYKIIVTIIDPNLNTLAMKEKLTSFLAEMQRASFNGEARAKIDVDLVTKYLENNGEIYYSEIYDLFSGDSTLDMLSSLLIKSLVEASLDINKIEIKNSKNWTSKFKDSELIEYLVLNIKNANKKEYIKSAIDNYLLVEEDSYYKNYIIDTLCEKLLINRYGRVGVATIVNNNYASFKNVDWENISIYEIIKDLNEIVQDNTLCDLDGDLKEKIDVAVEAIDNLKNTIEYGPDYEELLNTAKNALNAYILVEEDDFYISHISEELCSYFGYSKDDFDYENIYGGFYDIVEENFNYFKNLEFDNIKINYIIKDISEVLNDSALDLIIETLEELNNDIHISQEKARSLLSKYLQEFILVESDSYYNDMITDAICNYLFINETGRVRVANIISANYTLFKDIQWEDININIIIDEIKEIMVDESCFDVTEEEKYTITDNFNAIAESLKTIEAGIKDKSIHSVSTLLKAIKPFATVAKVNSTDIRNEHGQVLYLNPTFEDASMDLQHVLHFNRYYQAYVSIVENIEDVITGKDIKVALTEIKSNMETLILDLEYFNENMIMINGTIFFYNFCAWSFDNSYCLDQNDPSAMIFPEVIEMALEIVDDMIQAYDDGNDTLTSMGNYLLETYIPKELIVDYVASTLTDYLDIEETEGQTALTDFITKYYNVLFNFETVLDFDVEMFCEELADIMKDYSYFKPETIIFENLVNQIIEDIDNGESHILSAFIKNFDNGFILKEYVEDYDDVFQLLDVEDAEALTIKTTYFDKLSSLINVFENMYKYDSFKNLISDIDNGLSEVISAKEAMEEYYTTHNIIMIPYGEDSEYMNEFLINDWKDINSSSIAYEYMQFVTLSILEVMDNGLIQLIDDSSYVEEMIQYLKQYCEENEIEFSSLNEQMSKDLVNAILHNDYKGYLTTHRLVISDNLGKMMSYCLDIEENDDCKVFVNNQIDAILNNSFDEEQTINDFLAIVDKYCDEDLKANIYSSTLLLMYLHNITDYSEIDYNEIFNLVELPEYISEIDFNQLIGKLTESLSLDDVFKITSMDVQYITNSTGDIVKEIMTFSLDVNFDMLVTSINGQICATLEIVF